MNKFKQWIALGLLSLMLIKVWVIPLLYLDFEVRRDYIVANLCVNRNRPQLHCDGKCYLAKKLAALEEQEKKQAEKDYMSKLLFQPMELKSYELDMPSCQLQESNLVSYNFLLQVKISKLSQDIFHPPAIV
ncbi:hypothetical protein [Dyadobacter frigoris]|uniref:hypothetical protein n=1 Tax=Dyadobacter frigoris TaxID=2576211 RepID=UPI0015F2C121|nr:hypothetical protein [Dyadobacter frigoris]GLU55369.1 hypothetical protein Dfri01_48300 [Dyadobacter frigoris]